MKNNLLFFTLPLFTSILLSGCNGDAPAPDDPVTDPEDGLFEVGDA